MKYTNIAMDNSRSIAMTFKNEYVPPLEQETSEFFKTARGIFRTGHSKFDEWTVDRHHEMVLFQERIRRELESADCDLWGFIDLRGHYVFETERLSRTELSPEEVAVAYKLRGFWQGDRYATPSAETIASFKEALRERSRSYMFKPDAFERCQLSLIDGTTGKEI